MTTLAILAGLTVSSTLAAGPVNTYTRSADPSRSEGLRTNRQFVPGADPRDDGLISPEPYPVTRTDDPRRPQLGRVWFGRLPIGSRTPTAELPLGGFPGPGGYGAPPDAAHDVIFVQTSLPLPVIAISPWTTLDSQITDQIERDIPYIRRTRTDLRSARILQELREAQHQWLREQGYILNVRTHINPLPTVTEDEQDGARAEPEPSAIIRVRPAPKPVGELRAEAGEPAPGAGERRIVVISPVKTATEEEAAAAANGAGEG